MNTQHPQDAPQAVRKPTEEEIKALKASIYQQTGFNLLHATASRALQDVQRVRRESPSNPHGVKVGQIWRDNDKRSNYRTGRVIEVGETHARVDWGYTQSRVKLTRFQPTSTGYRLIEDVK